VLSEEKIRERFEKELAELKAMEAKQKYGPTYFNQLLIVETLEWVLEGRGKL
jgi:hypothetical protein